MHKPIVRYEVEEYDISKDKAKTTKMIGYIDKYIPSKSHLKVYCLIVTVGEPIHAMEIGDVTIMGNTHDNPELLKGDEQK